jgi:DNA-binding MarR family transcriptional regulator
MVTMVEQLFEGFSEEELNTFVKLAEKLRNNLPQHKN